MKIKRVSKRHIIMSIASIVLMVFGCVEPYEAVTETFESILVVEGTITDELKTHEIKLSRTTELESISLMEERNAEVKVIDGAQNEYYFEESTPGNYISRDKFSAQPNTEYTLSITTNSGKKYSSEKTILTQAEFSSNVYAKREIGKDSIDGVALYIDSFDISENSNYFRYEYEETYKIIAPYWYFFDLVAAEKEEDGVYVEYRKQEERICYNTVKSNNIILKNTNNYYENQIDPFVIRFVDYNDFIITYRYSMLLKQYAMSSFAYAYYKTHKDFSESESIFTENQTGFINGNLYSEDDPDEKIVGFFDVAKVYTKRIFFNYTDFYAVNEHPPFPKECPIIAPMIEATPEQPQSLWDMIKSGDYKFQIENDGPLPGQAPYYLVQRACGDCTVFGSNIVPDFWEE